MAYRVTSAARPVRQTRSARQVAPMILTGHALRLYPIKIFVPFGATPGGGGGGAASQLNRGIN
jgi:hypothetical protein